MSDTFATEQHQVDAPSKAEKQSITAGEMLQQLIADGYIVMFNQQCQLHTELSRVLRLGTAFQLHCLPRRGNTQLVFCFSCRTSPRPSP